MERVRFSPFNSSIEYEGRFEAPLFGILATPIPAYESLLQHLRDEGATLESLRIDAGGLAAANISCTLVGATIRFRINRFEISVNKYDEPSLDIASRLFAKASAALRQTAPTVAIVSHAVNMRAWGTFDGGAAAVSEAVKGWVGPSVTGQTGVGVTFYVGADSGTGRQSGNLGFDAFGGDRAWAMLKGNGTFAALPIEENAVERFRAFLLDSAGQLGIEIVEKSK